ncbi:MAG TPA: SDR family NAD(P)-dependent oxidoreductase, partial [Stellaceae bacterium]|nr:SDR family NAD(P)-dependent oxidoreductase [Stellaceae bacterium]
MRAKAARAAGSSSGAAKPASAASSRSGGIGVRIKQAPRYEGFAKIGNGSAIRRRAGYAVAARGNDERLREGKMRFRDKVALITAAASGIGRATADIMAREGALVVAVDNHEERLDRTVA